MLTGVLALQVLRVRIWNAISTVNLSQLFAVLVTLKNCLLCQLTCLTCGVIKPLWPAVMKLRAAWCNQRVWEMWQLGVWVGFFTVASSNHSYSWEKNCIGRRSSWDIGSHSQDLKTHCLPLWVSRHKACALWWRGWWVPHKVHLVNGFKVICFTALKGLRDE